MEISKNNNSLIIAHRGESFDAPENTIESVNLAWQRKADAVEVDVQLTLDNQIVVIHDLNTKRVGNRNKPVKRQTLNELKELDVGKHKGDEWEGANIPTLQEILETVPTGKKIIIEIKSSSKIIPFLNEIIDRSGLKYNQIEIICFSFKTICKVKEALPQITCLWLLDLDYLWINRVFKPNVDKLIVKVKRHNLDGLDVWAGEMLTFGFVEKVKAAGLLLYAWTVNDSEKAGQLVSLGVDGITTDKTQIIKSKL